MDDYNLENLLFVAIIIAAIWTVLYWLSSYYVLKGKEKVFNALYKPMCDEQQLTQNERKKFYKKYLTYIEQGYIFFPEIHIKRIVEDRNV